jgi:exodeoxyribonuclease VII small subunit
MAKSYAELQQELSDLLAWFESDDVDLDEAMKKYKRGLVIVAELEKHLKTAENSVKKVKSQA